MGAALPLFFSLIIIPVYLSIIGEARYGVMAIAWLLLGYFGAFDLGLGRATAQKIAALGNNQAQKVADTFWTALFLNGSLGLLGGIIIWPVAIYLFENVLNVSPTMKTEVSGALPWLILAVPITTVSGVLTGALQGREKFIELNVVSAVGAVLAQVSPLIVAWLHGPDLAWLLPAVILSRLVTLVVLGTRCRSHMLAGYKPKFSRLLATKLLRFGGWITVSSIIGPLMVVLDKFFIAAIIGPKEVAIYTIPYQLAERTTIVAGSLASALFPRFAIATDIERRKLSEEATRSLAAIITPIMVVGVVLVEPFLSLWISPDFATQAAIPAQILLLGFWINGFAHVPYAQLQAANRPHVTALLHMVELLPYLFILYVGLKYFGLVGTAFAFSLRTLVDAILLSWFAGTLQKSATILVVPAFLILCGFLSALLFADQIAILLIIATILLFCALAWSWYNIPPEVRRYIYHPLQVILFKGSHRE